MIEDSNGELKNLLEQRNRENKEGETLVALLRSDIEFSRNERLVHLSMYRAEFYILDF